jgi:hypothetical protein
VHAGNSGAATGYLHALLNLKLAFINQKARPARVFSPSNVHWCCRILKKRASAKKSGGIFIERSLKTASSKARQSSSHVVLTPQMHWHP